MRHSHVFLYCIVAGAIAVGALAAANLMLAVFMGAALGAAVAIMILGFPMDLSYRDPPRKRLVHVVMTTNDQKSKR